MSANTDALAALIKLTAAVITAPSKKYTFLVVSALREELQPFLRLAAPTRELISKSDIKGFSLKAPTGSSIEGVAYSHDRMGMPYTGVAITKLIERFKPKYVLFIGTCAGLNKKENKPGDVLIPEYIYAYDSGKYDDKGTFQIEPRHYEVSDFLQNQIADMLSSQVTPLSFKVSGKCGFCSGASVISNPTYRNKIIKNKAGRKVLGFDMESYVLAIINYLYEKQVRTIVIKGIMDFGMNKTDQHKKAAKENPAFVAYELIKYMVANNRI